MLAGPRRELTIDAVVLAVVVLLSAAPYLGGLGFYSDDWAFLAVMTEAEDDSVIALVEAQRDDNESLALRPTQTLYQAALFVAFGLDPLGYHVVNTVVVAALALAVYALAVRLGQPRSVAFGAATLAVILPHAATNRFWFASFGYNLSLALAAASVLAGLRAMASAGWRAAAWKAVALLLLVAAGLGYEVVLPLLAAAAALLWWRDRRRQPRRATVWAGLDVAALAAVVVFKAGFTSTQASSPDNPVTHLAWVYLARGTYDFGPHGLLLPLSAAWDVGRVSPAGIAVSLLTAAVAGAYVWHIGHRVAWPPGRTWRRVAAAGLVVWVLGYAVFVTTTRIMPAAIGNANRVAAAAVIGIALVVVGLLGLAAGRAGPRRAPALFASALAAVVACGLVTTTAVGEDWVAAADRQEEILDSLEPVVSRLPEDSAVVLAGTCPYAGAGIVFESMYDLAGAIRSRLGRSDLRADVIRHAELDRRGIVTGFYRERATYPYGERTFVWDASDERLETVTDRRRAVDLLGADPAPPARCADGAPGRGARERPGDELAAEVVDVVRSLTGRE